MTILCPYIKIFPINEMFTDFEIMRKLGNIKYNRQNQELLTQCDFLN